MISVCVAGATGWTGKVVAEAILSDSGLELVSAVGRSSAGQDLGRAWGGDNLGIPVYATVGEALKGCDVLVDYTSFASIREHTLTAIEQGVHVVVGSSGLSKEDLTLIDERASAARVGVFAAGNFSVTATLMQMAALLVAPHLPSWEILDYASATKPDSPSGTARELAERLGEIKHPVVDRPIAETGGAVEARGTTVAGTQVHSVRLPGFQLATELVFGLPHERLILRAEGSNHPEQFVPGTLLAIHKVPDLIGVTRELAELLLTSSERSSGVRRIKGQRSARRT
jgi:4-hydroxy-tetrahydrodipicolinate reductase